MKPLLLALLAISMLVGTKLYAQTDLKYYQYSKTQSFDVGVQPQFIYYDKTTQKAHVFCIGQDLNYDGVKDDVDYSPSWWTIEMNNGNKTFKFQDFAFGSFNMFYFRPAVDEVNRKIYVPSANKVFCYGLDDIVLHDSIIAPSVIEGMTYGFGSVFLSVNPTYGEAGKVLIYKDGALTKEIPVGVMAQNIAVYSNSKTQKAIAVVNIGNYGGQSSVSFIEFGTDDEYTKTDVEIGITANSIYYHAGYIYVICNSTNNTYKINAENYQIEKILHSGTTGWDGPRQMAFNNEYGFISDFSGDVRVVDLNNGVKDIINVGGKIESIAMVTDESFLTASQMKADYSSNNTIEFFEKKEYKFNAYHKNANMYEICEVCEKPVAMVTDDINHPIFVLCKGDSLKGIHPSIKRVQFEFPTIFGGLAGTAYVADKELYQFNTYSFKNIPLLSLTDNVLYVSTDEKIIKFYVANESAVVIEEYDFPGAFYLKSGKYFENYYVIGLNKEGSITVVGDETNIFKSDKPLVDGAMTTNFGTGDVRAGFVYGVDNKVDLELANNENNLYLNAVGKDGRLFTDDNFSRIFYLNYSDISSEIQEYDLATMNVKKTYNSGLVGNKSAEDIYSPETMGISGSPSSEAIVIPSELGDIRMIDLTTGSLSSIIPMPTTPIGYIGNESYFYTLLPDINSMCMYGLIPGAVKENINSHDMSFKVYPNPANSFTNIELTQDCGKAKLEVVSITGEVVFNTEFYGTAINLNLHQLNLPTGYYNVIITADGKKGMQSLVIIK